MCIRDRYAAHTNLDNVQGGVNYKLADMLGLQQVHILSPKKSALLKLVTFVPESHADSLRSALFNAGAGNIGNYDSCSYNLIGEGTFRARDGANPVSYTHLCCFNCSNRVSTISFIVWELPLREQPPVSW